MCRLGEGGSALHGWQDRGGGGGAATAAVRRRIDRYGHSVIPVVFEVGGRPSDEAKQWVRKVAARVDGDSDASLKSTQIWGHISCRAFLACMN